MKPYEQHITSALRSRPVAALMVVLGIMAVIRAWQVLPWPANPLATPSGGAFCPEPLFRIYPASLAGAVTLAMAIAVMAAMAVINRTFIILHTTSVLYAGIFAITAASAFIVSATDMAGMTLALTVLATIYIMYGSYQCPRHTRRLFMVFFLLSAGAIADWTFAAYIPVMFVGCAQMRCLTMRSAIAAIIGIITPVWILLGFGVADPDSFTVPRLQSAVRFFNRPEAWPVLGWTALLVTTGIITNVSNLIRVYSQNARTRAFNGILSTVTLATELLCMIDFGRIASLMPLLCCCVALQVAQYFHFKEERRGYIAPCLLIMGCALIYVWQLWIL